MWKRDYVCLYNVMVPIYYTRTKVQWDDLTWLTDFGEPRCLCKVFEFLLSAENLQ